MSKEEILFGKKMDEIFGLWNVKKNYRPDFLKNTRTGKNFEIDYYLTKIAVGFEYQGGVHFKDIKQFKNNSDKSRYHDLLKSDISLVTDIKRRKKPLTIVEIFEYDLTGDFRKNLSVRLDNSIEYYIKKNRPFSARNLLDLLCYIEVGHRYRNDNIIAGLIPVKYSIRNKSIEKLMGQFATKKRKIKVRKRISNKNINLQGVLHSSSLPDYIEDKKSGGQKTDWLINTSLCSVTTDIIGREVRKGQMLKTVT